MGYISLAPDLEGDPVKLFALIGALLLAGGVYVLIDGGIRLNQCISAGVFDTRIWASEFWLISPTNPDLGLSQNAHWLLRISGGVLALAFGARLLRWTTS